ncbi:hypothetical protein IW261DRAFT_1577540 [Armillaria novae-zelandiae]|uniref:DUF6532 domain-containing protein n=1 Tax=Armillaria novae-zelandiae TaxID=153914 RepID=A0AA39N831_9AGAR|nr:hypothetical protein IW261DRAFT_1577540 [Armillaria novae-zelandiae]
MGKRSHASGESSADGGSEAKRSRRSHNDLSSNIQLPTHTRGKENRSLSEKQVANEKASKDAEITQLRKQLAQSQKSIAKQQVLLDQTNRVGTQRKQQYYDDYQDLHGQTPPESESDDNGLEHDSDDDEEPSSHIFPTSLRSNGTRSPEPQRIHMKDAPRPTMTIPRLSFVPHGDEASLSFPHSSTASHSLSPGNTLLMAHPSVWPHTPVGQSQLSNNATPAALPPSSSLSLPPIHLDTPVRALSEPIAVPISMSLPPSQNPGTRGDKLSHYEGRTKTVLHKTLCRYEGCLGAINMCPDEDTQSSWAQEEWHIQFESDEQVIWLNEEMLKLIRKRGVRVRSFVQDQIKPLIRPAYGFVAGADSATAVQDNKRVCMELMTGFGFYYKDATTQTGYFNSPILLDAISRAFFYNKDAPGLVFPDRFNPIPVPALAFIFTVIEHCLNEWSTGSYKALVFNESEASVRYHEHHLPAVKEWVEISPDLTMILRKAWYTKARKQAGAAGLQTPVAPLKLSDSARELVYEEMRAMAAALEEEPQADVENDIALSFKIRRLKIPRNSSTILIL